MILAICFLIGVISIFFGYQPDSKVEAEKVDESRSASLPLQTSTGESLRFSVRTIFTGMVFIAVLYL